MPETLVLASPESRFRRRLWPIIAALLLAAAAGGGLWYRTYVRSPSYALTQARDAIVQHDIVKFDKYVDVESVVGSAMDVLLDSALQEMKTSSRAHDEWESMGESLGQNLAAGLITMMKPQLVAAAKAQVRAAIEKGDLDRLERDRQNGIFADLWKKGNTNRTTLKSVVLLGTQGKISFVRVSLEGKDFPKDFHLDFKLRSLGDHWQIIELVNMKQLFQQMKNVGQFSTAVTAGFKGVYVGEDIAALPQALRGNPSYFYHDGIGLCEGEHRGAWIKVSLLDGKVQRVEVIYSGKSAFGKTKTTINQEVGLAAALKVHSLQPGMAQPLFGYAVDRGGAVYGLVDVANRIIYAAVPVASDSRVKQVTYVSGDVPVLAGARERPLENERAIGLLNAARAVQVAEPQM